MNKISADRSVVRIESTVILFNWTQPYKTPLYTKSTGSGAIIDSLGNILTCAHVVENSSNVMVSLPSESQEKYPATIVSCCPSRDLAVINVPYLKNKHALKLAKGAAVIGTSIKVLGYPLGQTRPMLTVGIIGGINNNRYQIDAQINPGNSGGPLLDKDNQIVGVVDSIIYSENIHAAAISRAIPISSFNSMAKLALSGDHKLLHNPTIGVIYNGGSSKALLEYADKQDSISGALLRFVFPNSVLKKHKVNEGDIITKFNHLKVNNYGECTLSSGMIVYMDELMHNYFWNDSVSLEVWNSQTDTFRQIDVLLDQKMPLLGIRTKFPSLEEVSWVAFRGLIIMELANNHLTQLEILDWAGISKIQLLQYQLSRNRGTPVLVVTYVLPDTPANLFDTIQAGELIDEVNFRKVHNLKDFREALFGKSKALIKSKCGTYMSTSINDSVLQNEKDIAKKFNFPEAMSALL